MSALELTQLDNVILETIRNQDGSWVTRKDLSEAMGISLSSYHFNRLDHLVESGLIEARVEKRGVLGGKWFYRSVD